ncbi:hypothetical protein GCM10007877_26740 [Marinibactrum halimedae]|uniref:Uncharacterized protein n=1 Tax=Marinibactrum halimedae TaxID=1444977 RepID=A0AA37T4W6_9GAMM|nr:hypothetical protein GCM10007877_26740 [Marinibactrum halimedae]
MEDKLEKHRVIEMVLVPLFSVAVRVNDYGHQVGVPLVFSLLRRKPVTAM